MDPIAPVGLQDDDEGTLLEEAVLTLLLDSLLTLEEDFALSLLLLDPIVPSELQDNDERTLLLDSGSEPGMTEEEGSFLTLEEDFALSLLLLDSIVLSELQDDGERTLEEDSAKAILLLDSSLSLGVTGEELLSSSQAARRNKLEIANAIILFVFFKVTKCPIVKNSE